MSLDAATRAGWWYSVSPNGPWWALADRAHGLRYGLTLKRDNYNIELGGNNLAALKREGARVALGPLPTPPGSTRFTRGWWQRQRAEESS
jgi:hypothetical protein